MREDTTQVVIGVFNDAYGATSALEMLKGGQQEGRFRIEDAAVLQRLEDGTLKIGEVVGDMHGGKGALFGGVSGAVIGVLAGPVGLAAGVGALAGGLAAKLRDSGFKDEKLRKLGESLTPGTSALIVLADFRHFAEIEKYLANAGGDLLTERIRSDIADHLQSGRDIAYSALTYVGAIDTSGSDQDEPASQTA
jgi:uncharacterized membrane protein